MSDYYNRNNRRKKRSRREKIGFYTAFSICLIAVSMAVYSTYNTLSENDIQTPTQATVQANRVNNNVTGVTETLEPPKLNIEVPTVAATSAVEQSTEEPENLTEGETRTALQTMLSTDISLSYPLGSNNVIREYNEDSVYFKTLNVWKPHTGADFAGNLGDDVSAMTGGAVTKVYDDKMYGKTVEISTNDVICIYSGLGSVSVKEGDTVDASSKIGVIGAVPCEAGDENHIHVAVKVDGKYADPLTFIGNNE